MSPGTILIVDDSRTNLVLLEGILGGQGYEIVVADCGAGALSAVTSHPPDLILLDLHMAGMDGIEVCRRLKGQEKSRDIPVMFISAATGGAEKVKGLEVGAVDFVSKPVQREELLARVRTHLELSRLRTRSEQQAVYLSHANQRLHIELAERERIDAALKASLGEKEALLKEVHHRVKNNLALIISLMRLEARRSLEPETQGALRSMQARIRSVVLLNETLYRTESYSRVQLEAYLKQVATHLFQAQSSADGVRLKLDLAPVEVASEEAIPCALILNELVTNSLKHAFVGGRSGEVRVGLQQEADGRVCLQVSDTGVGLPEDFKTKQRDSLGLQLVSDLTRQLRGTLDVGAGACFTISFAPRQGAKTGGFPRPDPLPDSQPAASDPG